MEDNERFQGFSPEKQVEHAEWLVGKLGEAARTAIRRSRERFAALDEAGKREALEEGGAAEDELVAHFRAGRAGDDDAVEPSLARHRAWIQRMWGREGTPLSYAALGRLYAEHPGFRERYEARGAGFTDWLAAAMKAYAGRLG